MPSHTMSEAMRIWPRGRLDQALADFSAAIDHNFAGELAFLNRGIVYAQTGAFDLALKDFNEAARLNPSGTEVYYNRGLMYMRAAKYEAAISDFTTATTLNPRHADALAARGAARQAVGETTDAARDYYVALVNLRMLGLRPNQSRRSSIVSLYSWRASRPSTLRAGSVACRNGHTQAEKMDRQCPQSFG